MQYLNTKTGRYIQRFSTERLPTDHLDLIARFREAIEHANRVWTSLSKAHDKAVVARENREVSHKAAERAQNRYKKALAEVHELEREADIILSKKQSAYNHRPILLY